MASLSLRNVYKVYPGDVTAVNDFNLEIVDQEFVVFVGPSGCGKSTTLRMIAGLEDISKGEIWIGDRLINNVPPKDRDIAMVFQSYALYPHMTVYDNMAFALKLKGFSKTEIDERVNRAAKILDIEKYLDRKPKALSGGQRQRVALGRAIVRDAKVFLMDEPLSNLDAKLRVQTRTEIIKLHQTLKTTFIYVTHDQTEAMTMGDRIVVMKDGFIQQIDTPQKIYHYPANMFVAGFIGSPQMNFLNVHLDPSGDNIRVSFDGENFPLAADIRRRLTDPAQGSREVSLGFRPEDAWVHREDEDKPYDFMAVVEVSELMGSDNFIYLRAQGHQIVVRTETSMHPAPGSKVKVKLKDNVHLFDRATEKTLLIRKNDDVQ